MTDLRQRLKKIDFGLISAAFALVGFGILVLYSISLGPASGMDSFVKKQLVWVAAGTIVMISAAFFDYVRLKHYVPFIYAVNIVFLTIVFVAGKIALGAQRWIEVAGFRFQPSELSKLVIIITLAAFLSEKKGEIEGWRDVLICLAQTAPTIVLIMLQPDLGTALVLVAIIAGMFVTAGVKPKQLAVLGLGVYVAAVVVFKFHFLQEYQLKRLAVFINPDMDPLGSGYNLRQSVIAIGSGGVFGKGLFSGTQSRLDFLPPAVRHTDFIFAVIGEELGLIGGAVLLGLIFLLTTRALRVGAFSRNYFGLLVASGIVSMWIFQIFVNVGMTIGIMPITGIPLPFVSYGGTSMVVNLAAVGLLLSIFSRRWD